MTKVVHLTTVHPRYDTRVFTNQSKTLSGIYGDDFKLLVADGHGDEFVGGVNILDLGRLSKKRIHRAVVGSFLALKKILKLKPQLVQFHDSELIFLGIILSVLRYKVIYDVHEDIEETIKVRKWIPKWLRNPLSKTMRWTEKVAALFFDAIITVTPKIAAHFPENKTHLVQNYPRVFELLPEESIDYQERKNSIVYVGGLTRRRSVIEIIDALSLIPESYQVELTLIGNFSPSELEQELSKKPGWNRVNFVGWGNRNVISKYLGMARAGLVLCHPDPNHMNAKPVKMYEYMATGLPIIASDFPVWRQQIEGVECALFINPVDPQEIANSIIWILENTQQARIMGQAGKKGVKEKYNWDIEGEKLAEIYQDLLAK